MQRSFSFIAAAFAFFAAACTHRISVRSVPSGAQVSQLDASGKPTRVLGRTPLETQVPSDPDYLGLEVTSPGFQGKRIYVPLTSGGRTEVSVPLIEMGREWFARQLLDQYPDVLGESLADLVRLQTSILAGRDGDVQLLSQQMKTKFDRVSIFHSLLGNYHFLKGDRTRARNAYERALELDPRNEEARRMLPSLKPKGG